MIKLEHVVLASPEQMEFIIEGMRNPMNSWEKSDSEYETSGYDIVGFDLGENDHSLMQRLTNAGTDHRKFMRMMPVYVRITAHLYIGGKNSILTKSEQSLIVAVPCIRLRLRSLRWTILAVSILIVLELALYGISLIF